MIYVDFETRSKCDLTKTGAWVYSQDPSTEVLCMAYAIDDGEVQLWMPGDSWTVFDPMFKKALLLASEQQDEWVFEAHNAAFEKAIWENVLGWPPVKWECSLAKCSAHSLPRALGAAGEALGLDVQKDEQGRRTMMKLCKPRKPTKNNPSIWHEDPEDMEILYQYCMDDVRAERALSKTLRSLNEKETAVWKLDQVINQRGILVDMQAIDNAIKISGEYVESVNRSIAELTNGAVKKITETKKLTNWLRGQGVQVSGVTKKEVEQTLRTEIPEKARRALIMRQNSGKTSVAKFKKIKSAVSADGRLRGQFFYHGAGTGRWAGRTAQLHNLPQNRLTGDLEGYFNVLNTGRLKTFELFYPNVMGTLSQLVRPCLVTDKTFYGGDYNAIEARVLLWLAEDDNLDVFRQGKDIYKDMAVDIYKIPFEDVNDIQRQLGKQAILGLGYQMGANKFEETCRHYNIHIDSAMAERVVEAYRKKYYKVKNMWYQQEIAAVKAVQTNVFQKCGKIGWGISGDFLYCKLPSKRLIAYPYPEMRLMDMPWGDKKNCLTFMAINATTKKWERTKTYGGMLVENMTQGTARDILAEAMLRLEDKGYLPVMHVHDEALCERDGGSIAEFESIMVEKPEWAMDLPLKVGGWNGKRYMK